MAGNGVHRQKKWLLFIDLITIILNHLTKNMDLLSGYEFIVSWLMRSRQRSKLLTVGGETGRSKYPYSDKGSLDTHI